MFCKLVCENSLCIYQKTGWCSLDTITLDDVGLCKECIIVDLNDKELDQRKIIKLQQLGDDR